jgi:hypothetical protein
LTPLDVVEYLPFVTTRSGVISAVPGDARQQPGWYGPSALVDNRASSERNRHLYIEHARELATRLGLVATAFPSDRRSVE